MAQALQRLPIMSRDTLRRVQREPRQGRAERLAPQAPRFPGSLGKSRVRRQTVGQAPRHRHRQRLDIRGGGRRKRDEAQTPALGFDPATTDRHPSRRRVDAIRNEQPVGHYRVQKRVQVRGIPPPEAGDPPATPRCPPPAGPGSSDRAWPYTRTPPAVRTRTPRIAVARTRDRAAHRRDDGETRARRTAGGRRPPDPAPGVRS